MTLMKKFYIPIIQEKLELNTDEILNNYDVTGIELD